MISGWKHPVPEGWGETAWATFSEDIGTGDLSSASLVPGETLRWFIEAQGEGVACGIGLASGLFQPEPEDPVNCVVDALVSDGDPVSPGVKVIEGFSESTKLLSRERTALNFIMMLSGTATLTKKFVDNVSEFDADIIDTRKTYPMMRNLQKYAVRCGGGRNHRMGLYDGIMLKDNHISAAGSISDAIKRARDVAGHMTLIEVECETMEAVEEAVGSGADIVMLDNMDPFMMSAAVKKFGKKVRLEASGGITLDTVRGVAATGVHAISIGALTHSAPAVPFHLEIE